MAEKSEFGRGLVICLVKFAEHFTDRWWQDLRMYKMWLDNPKEINKEEPAYSHWEFGIKNWGSGKDFISSQIILWASGAIDHLFEIEVPDKKGWGEIKTKVEHLQERGLDMGHGFRETIWKIEDVTELMKLTEEIAIMIDKKIGLKPDIGEW